MSDYTKTTNFAAKDSLPSGNSGKIVKGSEIDTEFTNIQTAVATKLDINNSALTGTTTAQTLTVSTLLDITSTTDASDATGDTGALRTEGGASIAKKLFVGTDLDVDGTTNLDVVDIDGAVNMASTALITGVLTTTAATVHTNGITMPDNAKAIFGTGSDLQIYHDGTDSYITEVGNGNLIVKAAGGTLFQGATAGESLLTLLENGAVTAYYDNAVKLATTSTGIDVTGTVVSDGLTVEKTSSGANVSVASLQNDGSGANTKADLDFHAANTKYATISGGYGASAPELDIKVGNTPSKIVTFTDGGDVSFYEDTGTTPKMFWDASAESLGIGTTSPISLLQLLGSPVATSGALATFRNSDATSSNTSFGGVLFNSSPGTDYSIGKSNVNAVTTLSFRNANSGASYMDIDSSGNVGIGATPDALLRVNGTAKIGEGAASNSAKLMVNTASGVAAGIQLFQDGIESWVIQNPASTTALTFANSNVERMRIDSSGKLLVGKTSATATGSGTELRGTQVIIGKTSSGTVNGIFFNHNSSYVGGLNYTDSATSLVTSSDERLKESIADADDAGSKIDAMQVRQFDWKADGSHQEYGFVAQELEPVFSHAVHTAEDDMQTKSVDYASLVPMLVKEIQSLRARVQQLENS